jgi:hypothetical protein
MPDLKVVCLLTGGPTHRIGVGGPAVTDDRSGILEKQPRPRHPFWHAVSQWAEQGRKVGDDGLCVWFLDPEEIWETDGRGVSHLIGQHLPVRGA